MYYTFQQFIDLLNYVHNNNKYIDVSGAEITPEGINGITILDWHHNNFDNDTRFTAFRREKLDSFIDQVNNINLNPVEEVPQENIEIVCNVLINTNNAPPNSTFIPFNRENMQNRKLLHIMFANDNLYGITFNTTSDYSIGIFDVNNGNVFIPQHNLPVHVDYRIQMLNRKCVGLYLINNIFIVMYGYKISYVFYKLIDGGFQTVIEDTPIEALINVFKLPIRRYTISQMVSIIDSALDTKQSNNPVLIMLIRCNWDELYLCKYNIYGGTGKSIKILDGNTDMFKDRNPEVSTVKKIEINSKGDIYILASNYMHIFDTELNYLFAAVLGMPNIKTFTIDRCDNIILYEYIRGGYQLRVINPEWNNIITTPANINLSRLRLTSVLALNPNTGNLYVYVLKEARRHLRFPESGFDRY